MDLKLSSVVVRTVLVTGLGLIPVHVMAHHGDPILGMYVACRIVDVKSGPGAQYETVRNFTKGKTFAIVGKKAGWLRVKPSEHATQSTYVDERLAVEKSPAGLRATLQRQVCRLTEWWWERSCRCEHLLEVPGQLKSPIPGVYLTTTKVDVRSGPGEDYAIIATIPKDTSIVIVGMEADWLRVASKHGDPPGYIERRHAGLPLAN